MVQVVLVRFFVKRQAVAGMRGNGKEPAYDHSDVPDEAMGMDEESWSHDTNCVSDQRFHPVRVYCADAVRRLEVVVLLVDQTVERLLVEKPVRVEEPNFYQQGGFNRAGDYIDETGQALLHSNTGGPGEIPIHAYVIYEQQARQYDEELISEDVLDTFYERQVVRGLVYGERAIRLKPPPVYPLGIALHVDEVKQASAVGPEKYKHYQPRYDYSC